MCNVAAVGAWVHRSRVHRNAKIWRSGHFSKSTCSVWIGLRPNLPSASAYIYTNTRARAHKRTRARARTHTHIHRSPCPFRTRWVAAPCMMSLCLSAVRLKSPPADETSRTIHSAESLRCIASHGPTRAAQRSRWAAKAIRNGLVVVIDVTFAREQRVGDDDGLHRNRNVQRTRTRPRLRPRDQSGTGRP